MKHTHIVEENLKNMASMIVKDIQTEIIDASAASRDTMVEIIENSSGDFIDSFKTEIVGEVEVIKAVGELLIEVANYIQSAAEALINTDTVYSNSNLITRWE